MEPERWRLLEDLFHAALSHAEGERSTFLAHACAGDETLRGEVEALLDQTKSVGLFDVPALVVAAHAVSEARTPMLTGRRIGIYEVQAPIGAGGMGVVYRALDTRLNPDLQT